MLFNIFPPLLLMITTVSSLCYNESVCTTALCKTVAKKYLTSMNMEVNPCDNFYEYVCSGWNKTLPFSNECIPGLNNFYATLRILLDRVTYSLHNYHGLIDKSAVLTKLQNLYKGCLDQDSDTFEKDMKLVRNALRKIGGCPFIGFNIHEKYNVIRSLSIMSKEYDITDAIFWHSTVQIAKDPNGTESILIPYIKPSHVILSESWNDEYTKSRLKIDIKNSFFYRLGIHFNISDFDDQIEEMLKFAEKLKQYVRPAHELFPSLVKSLHDLQTLFNKTMDFEKLVSDLYAKSNVSSDMPVAVFDMENLKSIATLLNETNKNTIANYLCWRTHKKLKEHLPFPFPKTDKYCTKIVFEHMAIAVAYIYENNFISYKMKHDVHDIAESVKLSYIKHFINAKWLSVTAKRKVVAKLHRLNVSIGYPTWLRSESTLNHYYKYLGNIDEKNFFQSILYCLRFIGGERMKLLHITPHRKHEFPTNALEQEIIYKFNGNNMLIPVSNLMFPFYEYDLPTSMMFGSIGSEIAREMFHGVDSKGNFFDEHGNHNQNTLYTTRDKENFEEKSKCFVREYDDFFIRENLEDFTGKETAYENIADNVGLHFALQGYRKYLQTFGTSRDKQLPYIKLTPQQLFFVSFAYKFCGNDKYYHPMDHKSYSPFNMRVIGALTNSREFQKYFHCKPGERMYRHENICDI